MTESIEFGRRAKEAIKQRGAASRFKEQPELERLLQLKADDPKAFAKEELSAQVHLSLGYYENERELARGGNA